MKLYLAPLEGITGYIYRNAWHKVFGGEDRCYTPFLSPNQNYKFQSRERNDVCPEHNREVALVPQLLTNRADYFLWAAGELEQMGYREVNLNLGCPSGTVTAKKKGSGLLAYPEELEAFLAEIFQKCPIEISVKTRLGKERGEEFGPLLDIFNRYPIKELIVHPRVQKDFYKNSPDLECFRTAAENSRSPVCYNGDIFTLEDFRKFQEEFPGTDRLMLGRGVLANPALMREIRGGEKLKKEEMRRLHDEVLAGYQDVMPGERPVLFKMKELWAYMAWMFPEPEKKLKKLWKTTGMASYEGAVREFFWQEPMLEGAGFMRRPG